MHEELEQLSKNDIWKLVVRPQHTNVIGIKWILEIKVLNLEMLVKTKLYLLPEATLS